MEGFKKDKSLKLAAAAVTFSLAVAFGGALLVKSATGLVFLISLEALILIGAGVMLSRTPDDKGH